MGRVRDYRWSLPRSTWIGESCQSREVGVEKGQKSQQLHSILEQCKAQLKVLCQGWLEFGVFYAIWMGRK